MIKGASTKSSRSMASTAILSGRHVSVEKGAKRFTTRFTRKTSVATGCCAIVHDVSMIKVKCWNETLCVMAHSAISSSV